MIPFQIPAQFLSAYAAGEVVRYGAVLKDVGTGQILAHLQEVGGLGSILQEPLKSLGGLGIGSAPGTILQAVGSGVNTAQLAQISNTLETLQIITTVGAVASVATLGVAIVGLAVVNSKLNRLDAKLDRVLDELHRVGKDVERLNFRLETLDRARLSTALDRLAGADLSDPSRRVRLLEQAESTFHEMRNMYFHAASQLRPWTNSAFPMEAAAELHGRFVACAVGELEALLRLEDLRQFQERRRMIAEQHQHVFRLEGAAVFRERLEAARMAGHADDILSRPDHLTNSIQNCNSIVQESQARLETHGLLAEELHRRGYKTEDLKRSLESHRAPDLLLLPA